MIMRLPTGQAPFLTEAAGALRGLKGRKIARFCRLVQSGPHQGLDDLAAGSGEPLFSLGRGPAFLLMNDGLCLGLDESYKEPSVVAWVQDGIPDLRTSANPDWMGVSEFLIDCGDPRLSTAYWASLAGGEIEALAIVKAEGHAVPADDWHHQRGLLVVMKDGLEWMLSVLLYEGAVHFVMTPREEIDLERFERVELVRI